MRKVLLLSAALLLDGSSAAAASGILHMAWDACLSEGGARFRTFACTSNLDTGADANVLVPSVTFSEDIPDLTGFDVHVYIDVRRTNSLPAWYGAGCPGKPSILAACGPASLCSHDPYAGLAGGGIVPLTGSDLYPWSTGLQLRFAFAVPAGQEPALAAGIEYPVGNLTLSNAHSTGADACEGCLKPACMFIGLLTYGQSGGRASDITGGTIDSACMWQDQVACLYGPTRNATWGAVKALYR